MRPLSALRRSPTRQRGAALLMAMIIVTLVATLAAAMVWQQWRSVQVEAAERARTQSAWILAGALDWAKLILREDRKGSKAFTALTEPWAVPLAEARLSTFLAADNSSTDEGIEAFLSGYITDAQARFNLNNLIQQPGGGTANPPYQIDPTQLSILGRLCQTLGVDSGVPQRIATAMRDAQAATTANAPLKITRVSQLTWYGIDPATVQALEPYVVVIPDNTKVSVNVNTAPREVLFAAIDGMDLATSERILQVRQRTPFRQIKDFWDQLPQQLLARNPSAQVDVLSSYFEIRGRLRLSDRTLEDRSLVRRDGGPRPPITVLQRERISSREP